MNDNASTGRLSEELWAALDRYAQGLDPTHVIKQVEALSSRYRAGGAASRPILSNSSQVAAYAVYRMPATFAAASAALRQVALSRPDFKPRTLLDLGGGTGAATWAAASVFPSLKHITVVDHAANALSMGRTLAARTSHPALRAATWRLDHLAQDLPRADLVIVSYVLSELTSDSQRAVIEAAARVGRVVVVVEPGTPDGYQRVLDVRDVLLGRDWALIAPCPHSAACPLTGSDWCHFVVRVARSALHRRAKNAHLGHEDEKFAYIAAHMKSADHKQGQSRILRHPAKRKGLVQLRLCHPEGNAITVVISKRQGPAYRAARNAEWGDPWPSHDSWTQGLSAGE